MSTPSPRFLRGSLITLRRKCGKPKCRCAGTNGIPHESPALSCTIRGKSHVITLLSPQVPVVRAALLRYRAELERLEVECAAGIAWLRAQVDDRRSRTGRR